MARVDFYQLSRQPVDQMLPRLAERVLADGARLLIVADDAALLGTIDDALWSYRPESFLPHGRVDADGAADQPVLLADTIDAANGASHVAIADGRWRAEALSFTRLFYLFGSDTLEEARQAWKMLDAGERHFWKQDERGKWAEQR